MNLTRKNKTKKKRVRAVGLADRRGDTGGREEGKERRAAFKDGSSRTKGG